MRFERSEYVTRLNRVKEAMHRRGIELLVVANPANMCYLTGYDGWSFYVPQCILVELNEDTPVWIGRGMDANAARVTTSLKDDCIIPYPDEYVQSLVQHPMDFIADYIRARDWDRKFIGVEMDAYYFTAKANESLRHGLPDARFIDSRNLVNWVRLIKSPQEIEYMRQAARILERVMQTAFEVIEPGVRQCDAASRIYQAQIHGTEEFGGDYTAICPMLPTGVGTSTPHLTWTDEPFKVDETTIVELAAARHHYHAPMARTIHLGKPPQNLADTAEIVVEGIHNALDFVKPGVTCEQVEEVWRNTIAKYGIVKNSRCGYAIGLNYPPDWGEHTISLRPGDKTILQPNTAFHFMPGIWMNDWGVEISEPVLVTENGCETLADVPRKLIVKDT
ncbi:MAG: M24 family metallopeptidase [Arenicellales bacterium]